MLFKKTKIALCFLLASIITPTLQAGDFDIALNSDTFVGGYASGGTFAGSQQSKFELFYNKDRDRVVSYGWRSDIEAVQDTSYIFSLGVSGFALHRELHTDSNSDNVSWGLAIDLATGYRFSFGLPMQVILGVSHSPDIVNSGKLKALSRINARLEVHLTPSVIVHSGLVNNKSEYSSSIVGINETFSEELLVGFRIKF